MSELSDERLRAEIEKIRAETLSFDLDNRRIAHEVAHEDADSVRNRVFTFYAPIVKAVVADCILQLENWFRQDPSEPIRIDLYSPGGEVFAGFALIDSIRSLRNRGATVNIKASGYVASMATVVLQAASNRIASPHSFFMMHEISSEFAGTNAELKDQAKLLDKMQNKADDLLVERSPLTRNQLRAKWKRQEFWVDADEALALGLVDTIES